MDKVIKRDGSIVPFDGLKIANAIQSAGVVKTATVNKIVKAIEEACHKDDLTVEAIQDKVESMLMASSYKDVAREYIRYRQTRSLIRNSEQVNESVLNLIDGTNEYLKTENSNKNPSVASTQRDYIAGEVSKDISRRLLFPKDCVEEHERGSIHIHDMDYFIEHIFNCCLVNLEDILQNGTVINGTLIEKPHSFSTACNIASQVAAIVASNQYGGQTMSYAHLAPFVEVTRQNLLKKYSPAIAERLVQADIERGVQTLQYQILTLSSTNGQTPFISMFAYLNEAKNEQEKADLALIISEVLRQRKRGVKNEKGAWVPAAFPKILYVLEEDNIHEDSKYYWLTRLAAECTASRMVPDYISEKQMLAIKGYCFPCMGCRSFLAPWFDAEGKVKFYGRFNIGVCTLNLPYIALESKKTNIDFFTLLDKYLEVAHRVEQTRFARLWNTPVETSPMHWLYGAIARLPKRSNFNELLKGGYASASIGYAGIYETCMALIGKSHTTEEGKELAIKILKRMNEACDKWKEEDDIGYSVYGTPLESTTYKFAKALQRDFGVISNISDYPYVTNSYHVNVREHIDPFTKLALEGEFQRYSSGGCISYIETSRLDNNIEAVLEILKHIYEHTMYAELNTKADYCQVCDSTSEIQIKEDEGKLVWECPNCGNRDQNKMQVTRRTCGYLGTNYWNQGRTAEIRDRVVHLGNMETLKL